MPQEVITFSKEGTLAVVNRGICSLQGHVKTPGTTWGQDFILSSSALKDFRMCLALTYVELHLLARGTFMQLLTQYADMEASPVIVRSSEPKRPAAPPRRVGARRTFAFARARRSGVVRLAE